MELLLLAATYFQDVNNVMMKEPSVSNVKIGIKEQPMNNVSLVKYGLKNGSLTSALLAIPI
jgi:DNA mismatch repair ATPase MutS